MIAEVLPLMGRYHLVVNGVYVAKEDDHCPDPAIHEKRWTKKGLDLAALLINEDRWSSHADRARRRED